MSDSTRMGSEAESADANAEAGAEARYRSVRDLSLDASDALSQLLAHLSDASWRVRKAAVDRLLELNPVERAVPGLINALGKGDDAAARNAAAEALARIGPPAVRDLAARLTDPDSDVRKFAADILGEIGHPDGVEPLSLALDDVDRNVRASAAEGLGKVGGARAAVALERALRADDHLLRVAALEGLWRTGVNPSTSTLERLVRDRFLRRPVYRLLARAADERALELLLAGLEDPGRSTREAALAAIAEQARRSSGFFFGHLALLVRRSGRAEAFGRAARAILSRQGDEDALAVEGALLVLGTCGRPEDAVAAVDLSAQDRFRDAARITLAGLGEAAKAPLAAGLGRLPPGALELCAEVLGESYGPTLTAQALSALDAAPPEVLGSLFEVLGRVGGADAVQGLVERFDDPLVGELARRSLGHIARRRPKELLGVARELWKSDPSPAACFLLGEVGEAEDVAMLLEALRHSEPRVRVAAARALGSRGTQLAADALRSGLTDESDEVRAGCVRALGALKVPDLATLIGGALMDSSPQVAIAAAEVAGSSGLRTLVEPLRKVVERPDGPPALASLDALERLDGLNLAWLEHATEHPHAEVARAALLLAAGRAGGLELVWKRLDHPRWEVRRSAARVAGAVASPAELPLLREHLAREQDPLASEALQQAITAVEARLRP